MALINIIAGDTISYIRGGLRGLLPVRRAPFQAAGSVWRGRGGTDPRSSALSVWGAAYAAPCSLEISKKAGGVLMTEVVAALIWDNDRFMICRRPAHKARGLLWEFPGGKLEPGETNTQALIRECREELGVTVSVGGVFMEVVHEYPDLTARLTLLSASIAEGVPQKLEHEDIRWITVDEIPEYAFCPADEEILRRLRDRHGSSDREGSTASAGPRF